MKKIILLLAFLQISLWLCATHNRAGEITIKLVSGNKYEISITTFTYSKSAANRSELTVYWGDNTSSIVPLTSRTTLPNDIFHNVYVATHTFPGPGTYKIYMEDPNRNAGVVNIPNSVNEVFSISTTLIINSGLGYNNTPLLLNDPVDKAVLHKKFIHNPSAFDIDGDSLSYSLTVCTGTDGGEIINYILPEHSDTFYVDPVSGDLVWDAPTNTGEFNVAMKIDEWRNGIKISSTTRDMQIEVFDTDNNPPVNSGMIDLCVEAGTIIEFQITSTDRDNDLITQTLTGGPFELSSQPATFTSLTKEKGVSISNFRWETSCDHVREQPYQLTIKSTDDQKDVALTDIDNFTVKVLASAPENLQASANTVEIKLTWNRSYCGNVKGYYIYRREGGYGFIPDSCEYGVPSYTGYELTGMTTDVNDTIYVDDNNGVGLTQGIEYCYLVTSYYSDGGESFASNEACSSVTPGFPSIMNTSVTQVDKTNGSIYLSWVKPKNFDKTVAPGPYVYQIFRASPSNSENFLLIDSVQTVDLNDTTYIDSPLNTMDFPYYYTIKMFNNTPGNRFIMRPEENETASSLYMTISSDDNRLNLNIHKKTPWVNSQYIIYRQNSSQIFDSIGVTNTGKYTDTGLNNGTTYCYKVKSIGWRQVDDEIYNNTNLSHISCGVPIDTTASCAPELTVESLCDSFINVLTWTNPNNSCSDDVIRYNIYFADNQNALSFLTSLSPDTDTSYYHHIEENLTIAGCYAVSAIDSFENESNLSAIICVDECSLYKLPNVFTPNGDEYNDLYTSYNLNNAVKKVDMKIFNRWGQIVYETHDPDINWDGKIKNSDRIVSSGVYYYTCNVYEPRVNGIHISELSGFIHVYTDNHPQSSPYE